MNPREFEEFVCEHYRKLGYKTEVTPFNNDYGVDAFAIKGKEKIAIQAKMYGGSTRKINRQMIMELHGAKDYFDCTKAAIVTDGQLLSDAITVAKKLKIEVLYLNGDFNLPKSVSSSNGISFEDVWEKYIIPLQGKVLTKSNGETNTILKVDWSGVERLTSNGKTGKIKIEIFKLAINKLLSDGFITREEINQNYSGRASSGIVMILAQVPFFHLTVRPTGLSYRVV